MRARIDAIYKRGKLRLLKPVSLAKGTQVEVVILANDDDRNEQNYLDILSEAAVSIEHDLKSLLGIMEMDILRLKQNYQATQGIPRELESLETHRRKIFEIVNVISFMRVQGDFAHRRFERIRVKELLHTAIQAIKGNLNDEKIRFQMSGDGLFAYADSRMLAQGISSLIQNFVDAIQEAGRQSGVIHVDLKAAPQPRETLVIQITDRDRTLPQKDNLELKDLFSIKDRRDSREALGLFLVQRIIRLHDGFTNLQRVGEQGAILSIFLPAG